MQIYAMADIHGDHAAFASALRMVDLACSSDNKLIILGDLIDGADGASETLRMAMDLDRRFPRQVVALRGNHEERLLWWLSGHDRGPQWLTSPLRRATLYSLLEHATFWEIMRTLCEHPEAQVRELRGFLNTMSPNGADPDAHQKASRQAHDALQQTCPDILRWIEHMPLWYETDHQIFVHAGIREDVGPRWKQCTPPEWYCNKYPPASGHFYKDVIAGHIGTCHITGDPNYHQVLWDGQSHFYLDGSVHLSHVLPVLKYDTSANAYTTFIQAQREPEAESQWIETPLEAHPFASAWSNAAL